MKQPARLAGMTILALILANTAAGATLPVAVGDKELPTLAPMIERAAPAVVNIATRGNGTSLPRAMLASSLAARPGLTAARCRGPRRSTRPSEYAGNET